jgi:ATP-binding cassette subfamily B multidrug efflux pump
MTTPAPASGERVATRDQMLSRGWMGSPPPITTSENAPATARRLLTRMRPERTRLILSVVLTAISVAFTVTGPKLLGDATDVLVKGLSAPSGVNFDALGRVLGTATFVYLAGALLSWLVAYIMAGVVQRSMSALRRDVEEKVHELTLSYVDRTPRGDLMSRVTNDIDNIAQSVQMTSSQALNAVLTLIGVTIMMLWISPLLAACALTLIPLSMVMMRLVLRRSRKRFIAQWTTTGILNGQVEEAFTGHAVLKAFDRQGEAEERFVPTNDELFDASFRAQFMAGLLQPGMMLLGNLNYVVIAVVGALRVAAGAISIGDIQAFIQYSRQFTQPLTMIGGQMNLFQSGLASAERVFALLDAEEQSPDPYPAIELPSVSGRVEFRDVCFSYDPAKPLIQDLSLTAEPGQTVAIVGPTGAGKTTLVNLIMRFYEIDSGAISIDGVDIRTMTREELRSKLGMVLQDTWLFEGTIHDNIAYGRVDATDDEIMAAAQMAHVDHFVHTLPDGYETHIDEEGGNLSAGEKQLLTIARAFLSDPSILILDEATSSVDTRTEVLVQHAMAALRSRRTSFVIAHRLSTIRDADHILMMDGGRIVEQGTHEELLVRRGAYFELYDSQFRSAAIDVDETTGSPVGAGAPGGRRGIPGGGSRRGRGGFPGGPGL